MAFLTASARGGVDGALRDQLRLPADLLHNAAGLVGSRTGRVVSSARGVVLTSPAVSCNASTLIS